LRWVVTGAGGFIGRQLCLRLLADGHQLAGTFRGTVPDWDGAGRIRWFRWDGTALDPGLAGAVRAADGIVHLVARTHVLDERSADVLAAYREVNVDGTARLLEAARDVGGFLFLSSVKVLGEASAPGAPFRDGQAPAPTTPYGLTKLEAERLIDQARPGRYTTIRPPLVYGPGVKGNFLRLLGLVERGLPLPLGSVRNARSLVFTGNLVDAMVRAMAHPEASGGTFLIADGEDLSTPGLVGRMASALGRPARLFPCPPILLSAGARLLGRQEAGRLLGSLQVDGSGLAAALGWRPPWSVDRAMAETGAWFLSGVQR